MRPRVLRHLKIISYVLKVSRRRRRSRNMALIATRLHERPRESRSRSRLAYRQARFVSRQRIIRPERVLFNTVEMRSVGHE